MHRAADRRNHYHHRFQRTDRSGFEKRQRKPLLRVRGRENSFLSYLKYSRLCRVHAIQKILLDCTRAQVKIRRNPQQPVTLKSCRNCDTCVNSPFSFIRLESSCPNSLVLRMVTSRLLIRERRTTTRVTFMRFSIPFRIHISDFRDSSFIMQSAFFTCVLMSAPREYCP